MGNTSSQQRQNPMMRSESEISHKFLEDQIEERSRNRTWPNHQSVTSLPYNQPDMNSNNASSINLPAKPQKTTTSTISKTHRKIVSLGGLSKNSTACSTTNGVAIQQLSSATISGSGKPNNKLKVSIILNKPFYTAGTELTGFIELTSLTKESLGIADITLELTGYEELDPAAAPNIAGLSKPSQFGGQLASPTKTFYRTRLLLQDHEHPCSVVQDVAYPDAEGFWPCRKGKTSLPFLLRLAPTLPNAIITSQGKVSYYLEANIQLKSGIFKEVANFGRRVTILERWEPAEVSAYRGRGVKGETRKRLFMGGPRHLELESELVTSLVAAGSMAYVRITVRNLTTKKVQGVRLTLLQTAGAHEGLGPNVGAEAPTRPAVEKILKDADLKFSPGEERSCLVAMEIPMHCLSLRHTVLLKVSYTLQVALISSLSKDLTVDLPVYISHPSSWSDPCPSIERTPDALPETETEPFTKDQNDDGRLYSGNSSPPMLTLPEVRKNGPILLTAKVLRMLDLNVMAWWQKSTDRFQRGLPRFIRLKTLQQRLYFRQVTRLPQISMPLSQPGLLSSGDNHLSIALHLPRNHLPMKSMSVAAATTLQILLLPLRPKPLSGHIP
ncbi:hypothetical protein DSO57_1018008 [Entomophthora muscae]|uniref:Uncharacterized protein n=1 Tax=Entomophthora muscae TaxID=34485 RepID=A0ACC2TFG7_9FUNG|nr:hypothetical protein DSO57_1018008 [Entomophthora muscae]